MSQQFHELTALEVAEAIKTGQTTASAYVAALTSHIEKRDPKIEAWEFFDPRLALDQAQKLDSRADLASLPLAGVAVGVKDIIDTEDMPTENGTVLDKGRRPAADAEAVRLLRKAGAVIMGKTVTTELAFMKPARTRNPHNPEHTPGGSSSGSAAAVAAGMVPVALGTQTNGSVIRPASFCGIYALKPTHDLFSRSGVLEEAATFDTLGVFARSLEDVAAVSAILAASRQAGTPEFLKARRGRAAPRFAFVKTPVWPLAEEAAKTAFENAAKALGPSCRELPLPREFDKAVDYHRTIMLSEIALNFGRYYEKGKEHLSSQMREAIETGQEIRAIDYAEALRAREVLYERLTDLLAPYDAIITPPAPGPAPHGFETTGNPVFCTLWTYLGMPAFNLPLLTVRGLPLGIQLVGRRNAEEQLFKAAAYLVARRAELAAGNAS